LPCVDSRPVKALIVWFGLPLVSIVVLLVVAATSAARGSVTASPSTIFILAGQSNMLGRGFPLSQGESSSPNLLIWRNGWEVARDPLGDPAKKGNGIGPGMTFGLTLLAQTTIGKIGLVMCAQSGTRIADWQPSKNTYVQCISQTKAMGLPVAGVLFLQGESDADNNNGASNWENQFRNMYTAFQLDIGGKFIIGQIGKLDKDNFPHQETVRQQQAAAAADLNLPLVVTSDLPSNGEHFTVSGYKQVGARFASAWITGAPVTGPSPSSDVLRVKKAKPSKGPVGTTVVIGGYGFTGATAVQFNGTPAESFRVDSDQQITAVVADGTSSGKVSVTGPAGTATGPKFQVEGPKIKKLKPSKGPIGTTAVIEGAGFTGATAVQFNGVSATTFNVDSNWQITVVVPAGATSGKVTVTTPGGVAKGPKFKVT
jgi:Carbohydrate esterase, sialic acid-specific acetylesterase